MELTGVEIATLLGLVASGFVATSIDNLFLLVVLQGANAGRHSAVLLGFIASSIAVICVSVMGVLAGSAVGTNLIGYLGVVPLLLGLHMLYSAWAEGPREATEVASFAGGGESRIWFSTFVLMFSNSGDSIAVFLPLLAESGRSAPLLIICGFLVMALLWAAMAYLIAGQRALAEQIEGRAEKVVPWIMIGVGVYILMDTATDPLT